MSRKPHHYADLTSERFDQVLREVINDSNPSACDVLDIPGVYEVLSEHYNNAVLERYEEEHACEECGAFIPPSNSSEVSRDHERSCSLYPDHEVTYVEKD